MEDVLKTINQVIRSEEQNRTFFNPMLEASRPVIQVNEVSYSKTTWQHRSNHPINNQPHPAQFNNAFRKKQYTAKGSI